MSFEYAKRVIVNECLKPGGFAFSIRENRIDEEGFSRLLEAISEVAQSADAREHLDRLVVACLFELPWEIENTVEHYSEQSKELGRRVSTMADILRNLIHEMLWVGLESYYYGSGE